jgi:alpha/beta superfamily hydrolase
MGYSFGSLVGAAAATRLGKLAAGVWVAPPLILGNLPDWPKDAGPLLIAAGERDQFGRLEGLKEYAGRMGTRVWLVIFEKGDHFFIGREGALFKEVSSFLSSLDFMAH